MNKHSHSDTLSTKQLSEKGTIISSDSIESFLGFK